MKLGKKLISFALALVMVFGLTVNASAATAQNIKVQLSPNITVKLNGEAQTMLRSQGIPCKVVCGKAYEPGYDWEYHAWAAVSPDTKGLNMSRLGAGHDEDGWIRLDPTWASTGGTYGRSIAAIDKNHQSEYAY